MRRLVADHARVFPGAVGGYRRSVSREEVMIVPYRDGPYLVRGPASIRDQDGRPIAVTRRTVALCRCGKSRMRPFCDGTHRLVGFSAPSDAEHPRPASEARDGDDRTIARRHDMARDPHAIALAQLVRAGAKADGLLATPAPARVQAALRAAVPLVDAARLLLAQSAARPEALAPTPSRCLLREAVAVLSSAGGRAEPGVGDLVTLLDSVAQSLESNGSWP